MKTKKEFRYFTIFNHEKEQDYLQDQHRHGWKFVKVTGIGIYHFEECEPQDVVYQLDYNIEGLKNKQEYVQMFADCGWEYIQTYVDYSYFRKSAADMSGDEQIFSDESSRIAMMGRVYKGRLVPLLVIFFACLLPQFIMSLTNGRYGVSAVIGSVLALYCVIFAFCAVSYYREKD